MFYVIGKAVLALLAAAGLLAVGWLLLGAMVAPVGRGRIYAVVPAGGDGERLEQELAGLRWLEKGGMARFTVIIADCGLTEQGRRLAALLAGRDSGTILCAIERLPACLQEEKQV
ncbi:hypothetical protein [uncultured Pseudoflavonifractor sp.]|uniref:hypothetical protein n=1 Tax=uncultured Pseudoflavonifractor sp. TaxID=1221379 RepID=UPI0025F8ACE0|nr:hypothetical protein [uncultured Pseudoflavonifractor sp.]